jgi:hypothetical protein
LKTDQNDRARELLNKFIDVYPEFWQPYLIKADLDYRDDDSAAALQTLELYRDNMGVLYHNFPSNLYYLEDYGMAKVEIGRRTEDQVLIESGLQDMWRAFDANANSTIIFKKLASVLTELNRFDDLQKAARMIGEYKRNLADPYLQQLLNIRTTDYFPDD